ncbi:GNAT family N-acetyltransferase [Vibrio sp. SCSIO 43136]|nr:GNAT family N-acetyltransferase [Vibrio sp. SCSIO 43136]
MSNAENRHSPVSFVPVKSDEFESLFAVVKDALFGLVDEVFGWDDEYQRHRLQHEYQPDWFYWLEHDNQRKGMICYKFDGSHAHVHLLVVFAAFRNQTLGEAAMEKVIQLAHKRDSDKVTLSSFLSNSAAIRFYLRLGFEQSPSDENFCTMQLSLASRI